MKKTGGISFWLVVILLFSYSVASAQSDSGGGRDMQFEQQIYDRLAAIDPQAVPVFKAATAAADAEDYAAAKSGFEQVLTMAPGFPDALRRLSHAEFSLKEFNNAEIHARWAVSIDPNLDNKATLAEALTGSTDPSKLSEALTLAQSAAWGEPDNSYFVYVLMSAGVQSQNIGVIRQASNKLIVLEPEYPVGHYYAGLVAAEDGQWERAESELLLAQKYGIPKEIIDQALDEFGIRSQAAVYRGLRWGGIGLAVWVVGLLLLFLLGWLLSKLTLSAVNREIASGRFEINSGERFVRRLYRIVIAITSVYFYVSMPILILLVIALVGGIIYLFFLIGRIPVQLLLFILLTGLYTLSAIVRSIFARVKQQDPGRQVQPGEMPELWQMAQEVARKVGTRPIDTIFLTPGVEVAVTERGSLANKLRDRGQRILILGLGALSGMTQGQLRAILAHEYGHFTNRDTAGGAFARQVQFSVYTMGYRLAASGLARWYNPAWWFVNGYYRIFLRITLGASRLQEVLADRIAVLSYGIQDMVDGLKHVIHKDLEFGQQVNVEIERARAARTGLNNLYTLPPVPDPAPLEQKLAEIMGKPSSPYDSHPAPRDRLALIQRIKVSGFFDHDPRPAWDLIPDAIRLQEETTAKIEERLRQQDALGS